MRTGRERRDPGRQRLGPAEEASALLTDEDTVRNQFKRYKQGGAGATTATANGS